ncbi:hypothetical protein OSB04_012856 [Centaurea solstitialis]|uniref:Reverse transcriptase domain-containing protein n=1 Tax=Centaurea solstitialis TaxID=347529 RepID=A0AA38WEZ2_9ASTR|nr:hypothetical protein OSB04_012856 [Centaurea solstitialis]
MEEIRAQLGFEGCFAVDAIGHSGGLGFLWRSADQASLVNYSQNFINLDVLHSTYGRFRLTGFYGYPERHRRSQSWDMLRDVAVQDIVPWCCMGDFNDLLSNDDKKGVHEHPQSLIRGFQQAVSDTHLMDLPMEGYPFTWVKSKGKPTCVEERLDRALVNTRWSSTYPEAKLRNLTAPISDHSPILLDMVGSSCSSKKHVFRFENKWFLEDTLNPMVEQRWQDTSGQRLLDRLEVCSTALNKWGKELAMRYRRQVSAAKQKMEMLRPSDNPRDVQAFDECRQKLLDVMEKEEVFWKQRAKQFWLKDGDFNTKYFHAVANGRRRKKNIEKLLDDDGRQVTDLEGIQQTVRSYFEQLFAEGSSTISPVIEVMAPMISETDNARLVAPFTIDEFQRALFEMNPDKSPGPDGYNPGFYQHFWSLVGSDVFHTCCGWLSEATLPSVVNQTNIVLIPKVDYPRSMRDLRPISLCNVLYRILAKVLANRLRPLMERIIGIEQSAFVKGRSIVDNVMIAFEVLHNMKTKYKAKEGDTALKIDISKAYDRVDWRYLEALLLKMGFSTNWVSWMLMCVTSVSYQVVVNDSLVGPITPGRGLRQGCPLSPYLFILCTEGLSALLKKAVLDGQIHGARICRRAPAISHLLFADDSFLFFRADILEARRVKQILQTFAAASGQAINFQKSGICFSKNTHPMLQEGISAILDVHNPLDTGRYLGLPSLVGRNKRTIFNGLKDRIWRRIQSWRTKPLSRGGREILIKAVAQAIPVYCFNVFLLPTTLAEEIERMINSFWWGSKQSGGKGINWLRWEKLSVQKEFGGMGFRDFHGFNLAMLGKQGWKIFTNPDALVTRIYKAKYFPRGNFINSDLGSNPSYIWHSIWNSREVVRGGYRWRVGDGRNIDVWEEPWLRDMNNRYIETVRPMSSRQIKVCELLDSTGTRWDAAKLVDMFLPRDVDAIFKIPLWPRRTTDVRIWHLSKHGNYTVRSAYRLVMDNMMNKSHLRDHGDWKSIWRLRVPPKLKTFVWQAVKGVLPTKDALHFRGVPALGNCGCCSNAPEDTWHMFLSCSFAMDCWMQVGLQLETQRTIMDAMSFKDWFFKMIGVANDRDKEKIVAVLWSIWRERNQRVWRQISKPPSMVVACGLEAVDEWKRARMGRCHMQHQQRRATCNRWHPPPAPYLKCNCDAAVFADRCVMGSGMVLRDDEGRCIAYRMAQRHGIPEVKECESTTLYEALLWVRDMGHENVIFETDSQTVVTALTASEEDCTEFGDIIRACKMVLDDMPYFKVNFVRRYRNEVAHELARRSQFFVEPVLGVGSPRWLDEDLMSFCNVLEH